MLIRYLPSNIDGREKIQKSIIYPITSLRIDSQNGIDKVVRHYLIPFPIKNLGTLGPYFIQN